WETATRDIYSYDANNNVTEKTSQQWSGTGWTNQVKNFYTYDSNNNLTIALYTYWDNGAWINNQKYVYTYNQLNNITEYLYQKWINSDWANQFKYTYTYNSNNLLDVYLKQNWSSNNWVNSDRSSYNYDVLGNRIQTMRELWTNNNWAFYQLTTYTYNDTLLIHYKLSEYDGSQWQNKNQTSISHDLNGNKDTEVYQSWVNNDWLNTNKYIFSHTLITDAETEINLLTGFKLEQNYPNPFNPSTKIKFSIPNVGSELAQTVLKVYDVLGNEVATLVNEYKPVGSYEVEFNASKLSSGTYFYRLTAGEYSETKKLILIK
ncbi:MAG: T9SS type A sorting domain-containing protein, partial [Bacteroidia bacterium]